MKLYEDIRRAAKDEGISIHLNIKQPGPDMRLQRAELDFDYGRSVRMPLLDAYETLLIEAMEGDHTLFLREDEVEAWFAERMGERFGAEAINAAAGAWVDDCLSLRDRSLLVVAALVAQGAVDDRLRGHVRWAVEHGSSRDELEALVTLLAVYVGFPRASVAMEVVREELAQLESG